MIKFLKNYGVYVFVKKYSDSILTSVGSFNNFIYAQ